MTLLSKRSAMVNCPNCEWKSYIQKFWLTSNTILKEKRKDGHWGRIPTVKTNAWNSIRRYYDLPVF